MSTPVPFSPPPRPAEAYQQLTPLASLASLDQAVGTNTHVVEDLNALWAQWYHAVAHVPVKHLADDDLGRALDACLHLPVVLPVALGRLEQHRAQYQADTDLACERLLRAVAVCGRRTRARAPQLAARVEAELQAWRLILAAAGSTQRLWSQVWDEWSRVEPKEARLGWREGLEEQLPPVEASSAGELRSVVSPHSPQTAP